VAFARDFGLVLALRFDPALALDLVLALEEDLTARPPLLFTCAMDLAPQRMLLLRMIHCAPPGQGGQALGYASILGFARARR
jgi:hypothetical protein